MHTRTRARTPLSCLLWAKQFTVVQVVARTPIDSRVFARNLRGGGAWAHLAAKGVQPPARVAHAQCAVGPDLYIFGGRQGARRWCR